MSSVRWLAVVCVSCGFVGCSSQPAPAPAEQPRATSQPRADERAAATGGAFDYFLLTLSWSPEYCHSHRGAAQCAARSTFVLHGLWPENRDGTYPENCSTAPLPDNTPGADVYPDPRLARHEWQAHGTCSGMDPATYFGTAGAALRSVKVPDAFQQMSGPQALAPDNIAQMFAQANPGLPQGSVAVSCNNGYLTAVEVCMDKSLHGIACGQGLHSCNASRVKVPAP